MYFVGRERAAVTLRDGMKRATGADIAAGSGRPAHVTIGAGILIAAGAFVALAGLVVAVIGILYQDPSSLPSWADLAPAGLSPMASIVAVGALAYGIGQTVTGIGMLQGASWARVVGIVLAAIGATLAAAGVLRLGSPESAGATMVFLPIAAGYLYTIWALATHPTWFGDR
jgi:hypothetical protein